MTKLRVLAAATPRMLSDIVKSTLEAQPDMEIVGELDGLERLAEAASQVRPDLVVVADPRNALPEECLLLMYEYSRLRILVISSDGRSASLHRLLPHRAVIHDVSPQGLLDAIRASSWPQSEA